MFIGFSEKLQHICGNLEAYVHFRTGYMPRRALKTFSSFGSGYLVSLYKQEVKDKMEL